MLKLKNKFILFILAFIVLIVTLQIFLSPVFSRDDASYFSLVKGQAYINQSQAEIAKKYNLEVGDTIETKQESLGVVEWGDGSITRLGSNTTIVVKDAQMGQNNRDIQIAYSIVGGKTWSKVISFLGQDSYFKVYIDDLEAGVRGTTFEVNKDADYISVSDHQITLSTEQQTFTVGEKQPFSLSTLSFIEIQKFLATLQDSTWEELNEQMDNEYILKLKTGFNLIQNGTIYDKFLSLFSPEQQFIDKIVEGADISSIESELSNFDSAQVDAIHEKLLGLYQSAHFAGIHDGEAYKTKLELRKLLLKTSNSDAEKQQLIQTSAYEVQDMVEEKKFDNLIPVLSDIQSHPEIAKKLGISLNQLIQFPGTIPQELLEKIGIMFSGWGEGFNLGKIISPDVDSVIDGLGNLNEKGQDAINDVLDSFSEYLK